jgi:uncharacterized protein (DUF4213/DUF364 family)
MSELPWAVTDAILEHAVGDGRIDAMCLGLTWTSCQIGSSIGFAQSPGLATRTLDFPGSVAGSAARDIAAWLRDWDPYRATVGLAAVNALINDAGNALMQEALPLHSPGPANLAVFAHFRPYLAGRKVVVVGRYPGLDSVLDGIDVQVLERQPGPGDLPDPAAEYVIPEADWVFLTGTSLINKTFHRLAALARDAVTVLMGPSVPWLPLFADYGVDYLAGVVPVDVERAARIAAEGGGTRLFGDGVVYAVTDIGQPNLARLRQEIADTASARDTLKRAMEGWYGSGRSGRFPRIAEMDEVTARLSRLDTCFKRQWDARNG